MKNDSKSSIALLVLNYNGKEFLKKCLESLLRTSLPKTIYLIDNGSNDGSVDFVNANYSDVKIIANSKNLGFSEAYNRAIAMINEEYIVFLNNDIEVDDPNWLKKMMNILINDKKIGIVGLKTTDMNNDKIIDSVGGNIWRWIGIGTRLGGEEPDTGQYDKPPINPFFIVGVALLTKKSLFLEVGGFDSKMFAFGEDLDFSWKIRLIGYNVRYCPNAIIKHYLSGSWGSMHSKKHYLCCRNFLRSSLKNYSLTSLLRELPPYFLVSFTLGIMLSILREDPAYISSYIRTIFWNLSKLKDTLIKRGKIQQNRIINENIILEAMGPPLGTISEMISKKDFKR